ncbi:hypothetical protein [Heyndrickxia acidicola]|uniref:Abortive phage infection protein n=1 Tax=Heyndrickxia acidicola TaxID=209389 RepID=A0ABU6MHX5_9BACI|nr:hypothetical protein [Heyndrickxia acidicola]MED1204271.1 hypothetical protein [Heyndrickxia acidicola]
MTPEEVLEILEQLRTGTIKEYYVENQFFLDFRKELVKQKDFKHFQGTAERGGNVRYQYLQEARS